MTDDELFLDDEHPASSRFAVLEDDGKSIWLYLTEPGTRQPAADAWVLQSHRFSANGND